MSKRRQRQRHHDPALGDSTAADVAARTRAELAKLEQEVSSLRLQRWVAVSSTLIALAGVLLSNMAGIRTLFVSDSAQLQLTTNDAFLSASSHVIVHDVDGKRMAEYDLRDTPKVTLSPGIVHVTVLVGDEVVLDRDVQLERGSVKTIDVPSTVLRKIRVSVSNLEPKIRAGQAMTFDVKASGNGFVWLFRESAPAKCELVFPIHEDGSEIVPADNAIDPLHDLNFPRPNANVDASSQLGATKLHVLVTSSESPELARSIISHYCKLDTMKTIYALDIRENWGLQTISTVVF